MQSNPWLAVSAIVLCACGGGSSQALERRDLPSPPPEGTVRLPAASTRFVEVAPASVATDPAVLRLPARVVLRESAVARVGAPLAGRVVDVHVALGDTVRAGDPLVTLRSPDAAAARAALRASTAALSAAERQAERAQQLIAQGVGTDRERIEAEARVAELSAEVARARTTVGYVGGGSGATVVVRAPIDGTVLARSATAGASVEPGGEPLVEVGDPDACWIEADVFERDLPLVTTGATAHVHLPNAREPLVGRVVGVGALVRSDTRTAPVRIEVQAGRAQLRPGMFGRAAVAVGELGITLPIRAVLIDEGRRYVVYVAQGSDTFERREVEVGVTLDGRVQIVSGLVEGEQVVVAGALLVDGSADALL